MSETIPDSRSYRHLKCGKVTIVSEGDYKVLANPLTACQETVCAACEEAFPIQEFEWADTGENIVDYHVRHKAKLSPSTVTICSANLGCAVLLLGIIAGLAVGIVSGRSLGLGWGIGIGVVAVLVALYAAVVIWDSFTSGRLTRELGVPDVRCLK